MKIFHMGRRQFLKMGSAAITVPALMKIHGNAAIASETKVSVKSKNLKKEELRADLVVVGGGGGGMSAALKAAQLGVKDIIVLEKLGYTGGNALNPHPPVGFQGGGGPPDGNPPDGGGQSAQGGPPGQGAEGGMPGQGGQMHEGQGGPGGMPGQEGPEGGMTGGMSGGPQEGGSPGGPGSIGQEPGVGLSDALKMGPNSLYGGTADYFFDQAMQWSHWRMDARLIRTLLNRTNDVPVWLKSLGVTAGGGGDMSAARGSAVRTQAKKAKELGVQVLLNTAAKELITDKTGRVVGVVAETEEKELRISAKCVIMSTGGFLGSKELMKRFCKQYTDTFYDEVGLLGLPHTGDGFLMAEAIGGVSDGTTAFEWEINRFPWLLITAPLVQLTEPHNTNGIFVNKKGLRFCDESQPTANNAFYREPGKTAWILFDSKGYESGTQKSDYERYDDMSMFRDKVQQQLKEQGEKGRVKISDSWDEIADAIGCGPKVLKASVEEYNTCCDNGKDDWFLKDASSLSAIRTPPFYAIKCTLAMLLTRGPLKVSCNMEVVNKDNDPIPGLYAAGVDIGGTDEDTYWATGPCHSYIWAIASGCIAAENAARVIFNKA